MATPFRAVRLEEPRGDDSMRLREQAPAVTIWEPGPTATNVAPAAPIPIERELIAMIEQPLRHGETHRVGNDRKERELAALIETLTPAQSFVLSKRLAVNAASDPLAVAFGRLLVERRNRLVAFLARRRVMAR